jgi:hypothetical protein
MENIENGYQFNAYSFINSVRYKFATFWEGAFMNGNY